MSLITLNKYIYDYDDSINVDSFLDKIFSGVITIYEDVQGSKLFVTFDGNSFEFRTKSMNTNPLSLVDISLQKYYNKAINFFYSLDERVVDLIPKNWTFQFEYFPDNEPANIKYDKLPTNSLILTGIIKNKKYEYSIEEIIEFSNLLNVDPLPVIFYGKLNNKQKEGIRYFINVSPDDLDYVFGESNFAHFFYNLLDASYTNSYMMNNNNFQDNIERLIIRVNNEDMRFSILNPLYDKNNNISNTEYVNIYTLIIMNFLSFCGSIDISTIKLAGSNKESAYIDMICRLFNMYVTENGDELKHFEFDIPRFFSKDQYRINKELLPNILTTKYISDNRKIEYIFKCILGSFRYKKKKEIGLFTKQSLDLFNSFVDSIDTQIEKHLNRIKEDKIRGTKMMNFDDFYDITYDTDGDGKVYPDVYTEFGIGDKPSDKDKKTSIKK